MQIETKNYKDSVFRLLFNNKKHLLELYNAINGTSYDNPEDLEIRTLKGNTYLKVRNDVSFIIETSLNLYEHQSTPCPNIPLRDLYYVASILIEIIPMKKTYGHNLLKITKPHFLVFYNGTKEMPDRSTYKLSDMFEEPDPNPSLELTVTVYNVNKGHNPELMKACEALNGYSIFVSKVRKYKQEMENEFDATHPEPLAILVDKSDITKELLKEAINRAIDECIEENILSSFFREHRQEVINMSITEYFSDEMVEVFKEDGFSEGLKVGHEKGVIDGEKKGRIEGKIEERQDIIALFNWLTQNDRREDIDKALSDPEYLDKLFDEYHSAQKL